MAATGSKLSGQLWPCIACGVHCHGDHPHRVCCTAGLSHTVRLVHWWAPVSCVSSISCRNFVSRLRLILTWTICPHGRPSGQSAADWFFGEPAPAELASTVTSTPIGDGSAGLLSELMGQEVPEDVRFPEEMAAVVNIWEPTPAQLPAVVRLSEPAPARLDFTAEEPSLPEEEVAWPEAWFTAVQSPRELAPAEPPFSDVWLPEELYPECLSAVVWSPLEPIQLDGPR